MGVIRAANSGVIAKIAWQLVPLPATDYRCGRRDVASGALAALEAHGVDCRERQEEFQRQLEAGCEEQLIMLRGGLNTS